MSVLFNAAEGLITTQVRLASPFVETAVVLALDTGAEMTMVNRDVLEYLGYDLSAASEHVQITTGSGVEFVPKMTIARIDALEHEHTDFPMLCHTLPPSATVDGLLGLDFLRDKRLVLDFRAGLITLE